MPINKGRKEKNLSAFNITLLIAATLSLYAVRVRDIEVFNPRLALEAMLFGYMSTLVLCNGGYFRHLIRRLSDEQYNLRTKKYNFNRKNRFNWFPYVSKNPGRPGL